MKKIFASLAASAVAVAAIAIGIAPQPDSVNWNRAGGDVQASVNWNGVQQPDSVNWN